MGKRVQSELISARNLYETFFLIKKANQQKLVILWKTFPKNKIQQYLKKQLLEQHEVFFLKKRALKIS